MDWPTAAAPTGLLLTKGLDAGGALQWLGHWPIARVASERAAALALVLAAALLAAALLTAALLTAALLTMVLTNDVDLFVVVPLALGSCRISHMPATNLVVFEALARRPAAAVGPAARQRLVGAAALVAPPLGRQAFGQQMPLAGEEAVAVLPAFVAALHPVRPPGLQPGQHQRQHPGLAPVALDAHQPPVGLHV